MPHFLTLIVIMWQKKYSKPVHDPVYLPFACYRLVHAINALMPNGVSLVTRHFLTHMNFVTHICKAIH